MTIKNIYWRTRGYNWDYTSLYSDANYLYDLYSLISNKYVRLSVYVEENGVIIKNKNLLYWNISILENIDLFGKEYSKDGVGRPIRSIFLTLSDKHIENSKFYINLIRNIKDNDKFQEYYKEMFYKETKDVKDIDKNLIEEVFNF